MSDNKDFKSKLASDRMNRTVAWDKGTPKYFLICEGKEFYIKNLHTWCEFYEVNYQMLLRALRVAEEKGSLPAKYKAITVSKV